MVIARGRRNRSEETATGRENEPTATVKVIEPHVAKEKKIQAEPRESVAAMNLYVFMFILGPYPCLTFFPFESRPVNNNLESSLLPVLDVPY